MIINKNQPQPRARRSGKTVCATLAAAGLLSLAVAVAPAFAYNPGQIPSGPRITASGDYKGESDAGLRVGDDVYTYGGTGGALIVEFESTTIIKGALTLGNHYDSSLLRDYSTTVEIAGQITVQGDVDAQTGGGAKKLIIYDGSTFMVDGDFKGGYALAGDDKTNAVLDGVTIGVAKNIGQGMSLTSNNGSATLKLSGSTTGLDNVSISSDTENASITSYGKNGNNLNFGTVNSTNYGAAKVKVGNGNFDISTINGNINYGHVFGVADRSGTPVEYVDFSGNGNLTVSAGDAPNSNGSINFNAGVDLDNSAYTGNIRFEAANDITTAGSTIIKAGGNFEMEAFNGKIDNTGSITVNQADGKYTSIKAETSIDLAPSDPAADTINIVQSGTGFTEIVTDDGWINIDMDFTRTVTSGSGDLLISSNSAAGAPAGVYFGKDFTNINTDGSGNTAGSGDTIISAANGDIRFSGNFTNTSLTGRTDIQAAIGNIVHNLDVSHTGGQFNAVAVDDDKVIHYGRDVAITINDDSYPLSGAYIKTSTGNIIFNRLSVAGSGFKFDSKISRPAEVGNLSIVASTGGGNIIFNDDAEISFASGGDEILPGGPRTGSTNILTVQGRIGFNELDNPLEDPFSTAVGFKYKSGGGDLNIISVSAGTEGGNIIFYHDAEADFASSTDKTGNTLIQAYEGNVFTFGSYNHIGGTGDRSVASFSAPGLARTPISYDGNVREADFSFAAGGGSVLWAADNNIDLNISQDGATIGSYLAGMDLDFSSDPGGVALVAGGAITVYNSLNYTSGTGDTILGTPINGLKDSTITAQLQVLKAGMAGAGQAMDITFEAGTTLERKLVLAKDEMEKWATNGSIAAAMPKHVYDDLMLAIADPAGFGHTQAAEDFWKHTYKPSLPDFKDRLQNYMDEVQADTTEIGIKDKYGFYEFSREAIYYGKDLTLNLNGTTGAQAGYLQAPVLINRGKTTFNTHGVSGGDNGLTVYADYWNIMGGLEIHGDHTTIGSVTVDSAIYRDAKDKPIDKNGNPLVDANGKAVRGNPTLTLQGRIDLYDDPVLYDASNLTKDLDYYVPNLFNRDDFKVGSLGDGAGNTGGVWQGDDDNNPYGGSLNAGDPFRNTRVNNLFKFVNVTADRLDVFRNIISAASTNSFATDDGVDVIDSFLKADTLTSYGVEVFTIDTTQPTPIPSSGQVHILPIADVEAVALGDPNTAGMYAARWNLGETTYEQAAVSDSTLKQIFDSTKGGTYKLKEVSTGIYEPEDIYPDGSPDGTIDDKDKVDVYGHQWVDISKSQPGAHADTAQGGHKKFIGLGTEGNASHNYIRDGLMMSEGVDNLGYYKFGGADSGVISYQALQSKIVFDQEWVAANNSRVDVLTNRDTTYMNLQKTDFYGWMNVRDARTVMAAGMYNKGEHDEQGDKYVLNQTTVGYDDLGYGAGKNGLLDNEGHVWLESTGSLALNEIKGLENLPNNAYNPFPDSPFFNLKIGYLKPDKTQFGLIDFSRKRDAGGVLANLSNQAPSMHSGMAWVIENAAAFDSLEVAHASYQFDKSDLDYAYNNKEVKYDSATGKLLNHNGVVLDPTDDNDAAYIKEHIKFVELNDYGFQHDNNVRGYEYDRSHSVENILYLSPTRVQYNRDLAQISSAGNMDTVRMVNFDTMNNVFKMMAHRAAQRGWGLSAGDYCSPGSGLWGVADYRRTEVDGNLNRKGYAGFDIDRYGATIGYDHQVIDERLLMGGYFSYSRPELDGWGRDIKADDIQFGLYAQVALPYDFIINAGLAYGWQSYDLDRTISIGRTFRNNLPIGFGEKISADYNGTSFQFNLEFAKYFYFDNGLYLRPSAQYDFNRVDIKSYNEHSKYRWNLAGDPMEDIPSVGQHLSASNFDQHIIRLGGTIGWINECKTFEAAAKAYWVHNGGDNQATGRAKFNAVTGMGYNHAFDIAGAKYDRNQILYGVDLKFHPGDYDWSLVVGFEGLSGDKEDSYSGMAGFLYQF